MLLSVIRHVRPRTSSSPSFLRFVAALRPLRNSPYSDPDISILRCNQGDDASCAPCRSSTKPRSTLLALIARYFTNCVSLENIDSLIICVMIARSRPIDARMLVLSVFRKAIARHELQTRWFLRVCEKFEGSKTPRKAYKAETRYTLL